MQRPIRVALQLQPQPAEYSEIRDAVVRGEELEGREERLLTRLFDSPAGH